MRLSLPALRTSILMLLTALTLTFASASTPSRASAQLCLPPGLELARLLGGRWIGQGSADGQRWIANMRFTWGADPCQYPTLTIPNWGTTQIYKSELSFTESGSEAFVATFVRPAGTFSLVFRFMASGTTYWIVTRGLFEDRAGGALLLDETVFHESSL